MTNFPIPLRPKQAVWSLALSLLLAAASAATAEPDKGPPSLSIGDPVPAIALRDQNGADLRVDPSTRVLVFTRDMDGGKLTKEAFAEDGRAILAKAGAVYLSDVSRMPALVRSMFAIPALKKRPYPVAFDESGEATAALPSHEGKVTILTLDAGRITAIAFAASAAEVRAALLVPASPGC
jgi:hypothetical protein